MLIYVIDSADVKRLEETGQELQELLCEDKGGYLDGHSERHAITIHRANGEMFIRMPCDKFFCKIKILSFGAFVRKNFI